MPKSYIFDCVTSLYSRNSKIIKIEKSFLSVVYYTYATSTNLPFQHTLQPIEPHISTLKGYRKKRRKVTAKLFWWDLGREAKAGKMGYFADLQPMIQQSQLLTKTMFLEPEHQYFLNSPLLEEQQHKLGLCLESEQQSKRVTVAVSKKLSKKSTSKDSGKPKKHRNMDEANINQKFGHWTLDENKRYHWFLEIHNKHFFNKHMRRTDKIFKTMALFVGSREAEQCRSHHQKMEKKHRTIRSILISLRLDHYAAKTEDFLIQDLQANKIDIVDPILSSRFLENSQEHSLTNDPNVEPDKISEQSYQQRKQQVVKQQRKQQWVVLQQREQENEQIRLLPIRMDCFDLDMVDLLLGEQAPHNNYLMI